MLRLRRAVGKIELPVHQALGPVVAEVLRGDCRSVDGDESAADHGEPVVTAHSPIAQGLLKSCALLGLHVDDEAVRRVRRRGLSPAADQVRAQQHQQHQRQQTDRQCTHLNHGVGRPRRDLACGQHQPARRRRLVDAGSQQLDRNKTGQRKYQHRAGKAPHGNQPELEVAAGGQQQGRKAQHADQQHRQRNRLEAADVAADHPQRRHLRQLQHRRQAKGQQQRQAHAQPKRRRPECGRGQRRFNQAGQQQHEHIMNRKTQRHAQRAGGQAHQHKLKGVGQRNGALWLAEHAQHRAVVQMACRKTARHDRHRHGAEQRGQQRHQA